eukprot:CAMPEP_0117841212 /NCGR_PEP_ID=MMETSP0949-20121206/15163_1 /TAXON_ID=44440 /ORGANISM="Chattonella subsalsa, Strain CCMP2191" /LENGTH=66 /DNA_ID=CAMNT_0005684783 /DNA_START=632 /DNA_END=828 /DNA_ORIENTATION=-
MAGMSKKDIINNKTALRLRESMFSPTGLPINFLENTPLRAPPRFANKALLKATQLKLSSFRQARPT